MLHCKPISPPLTTTSNPPRTTTCNLSLDDDPKITKQFILKFVKPRNDCTSFSRIGAGQLVIAAKLSHIHSDPRG